ncbi:hypothetical protein [Rhodococcus sp. NPDC127528]|uniref:hypothetical protein n=1 Tax=unclassified Rhodococcus (in: high G+C Gram-positive bacteria) TaxID=192944 RepID=UPI003640EBD9
MFNLTINVTAATPALVRQLQQTLVDAEENADTRADLAVTKPTTVKVDDTHLTGIAAPTGQAVSAINGLVTAASEMG